MAFFNPEPIRRIWNAHVSGRADEHERLWGLLMFQSWLEANSTQAPVEDSMVLAGA